jgi:hypothetical protein
VPAADAARRCPGVGAASARSRNSGRPGISIELMVRSHLEREIEQLWATSGWWSGMPSPIATKRQLWHFIFVTSLHEREKKFNARSLNREHTAKKFRRKWDCGINGKVDERMAEWFTASSATCEAGWMAGIKTLPSVRPDNGKRDHGRS